MAMSDAFVDVTRVEPDDTQTLSERGVAGLLDQAVSDDPELQAAARKQRRWYLPALPSFNQSAHGAWLVFEAGSFGLRGALVRKQAARKGVAAQAEVAALALSYKVDFTQAIAEVLAGLRRFQKRLPRRAVLVTPSVVSALVSLPVSPLRPRSDSEMQELIRWELEGIMSQQNRRWLIGSMLVERGYLSAAQRDELLQELQIRQQMAGPETVVRFGEVAVELGYLTLAQLDECFALQGKLAAIDDELVFGWQAVTQGADKKLSDEVLLSAEDDKESAHPWRVSGMSQQLRRRWVGAFALNHIRLDKFYPALGTSLALLPESTFPQTPDGLTAVLEIHQEQMVLLLGDSNGPQNIWAEERLPGELREDELSALLARLPDSIYTVYFNSFGQTIEEVLFTVNASAQWELVPMGAGADGMATLPGLASVILPEDLHADCLAPTLAAARHWLGLTRGRGVSPIPARDKEPSAWRVLLQPRVLASVGLVATLATMSGAMVWMYWNKAYQENRLTELEASYERDTALKGQYSRIETEQRLLKGQIEHLQSEIKANHRLLDVLSIEQPRQAVALPVLMKAISLQTPPGVALLLLRRTGRETVIEAAAISETDSLEFVTGLSRQVESLAFQVQSSRFYQVGEAGAAKSAPVTKSVVDDLGLPYRVELVFVEAPAADALISLRLAERGQP